MKKRKRKPSKRRSKASLSDSLVLPVIPWRTLPEKIIAGTDEVGRGCLAGPVFAAAVILDPRDEWSQLTDSKLLPPKERAEIAEQIKKAAVCWAVGVASVEEIETINILQASLLAMKRAISQLPMKPGLILIDGIHKIKARGFRQQTFVKGDLRCQPISAASIVAKVARDLYMIELEKDFPGYGFGKHKGYGTPEHLTAIKRLGVSRLHRRGFAPIRAFLESGQFGESWTPGGALLHPDSGEESL